MPNFQRGMMTAVGRFATELMDQVGRTRGSSQIDRDLEQARGFLKRAAQCLDLAAQRLAMAVGHLGAEIPCRRQKLAGLQQAAGIGPGGFDRRSDNLQALLEPYRQR